MKTILRLDASASSKSSCGLKFKRTVIDGYRELAPWNDTQYGSAFHKFISTMYLTGGDFQVSMVQEAYAIFDKPCNIRPKKEHLTKNHFTKTCFDFWEHMQQVDDFEHLVNPSAVCWKCGGEGYTSTNHDCTCGFKDVIPPGVDCQCGANYEKCKWCDGKGLRAQPLVEQTFEIKVYEDDDLIIYVAGTMDKLGKIKNGCYAIGDYKVTSSWDIAKYLKPYALSTQLRLYHWAVKEMGKQNPDSLLAEVANTRVGTFIDGIFIKSKTETLFKRSIVHQFKDEDITEFARLLDEQVHRLVRIWKRWKQFQIEPDREGTINGECMSPFGCMYFDVCAAPDSIARVHLLRNNFKQKEYNPFKFNEA
jgi:hypothetical protein